MAGKNLDIKLVVDDAEAKRKIRETAAEAAKAAAPTPGSVPAKAGAEAGPPKTGALRPAADAEAAKAAGDAAKGMDEAGRKARELAGAAGGAGTAFQRVTRSFAGVAVSMGLNYARQFTREGSAAYNALGFASSAVGGMAMGAAAGSAIGAKYGPLGAAAGAAAGAGKGLLDIGKAGADRMRSEAEERAANSATLRGMVEAQDAARAFKATLDQVGDAEKSLAERQRLLASEIKKREEADKSLAETARKAAQGVADPDADTAEAQKRFAKAMADMNRNASELDTLRALQEQLKAEVTGGIPPIASSEWAPGRKAKTTLAKSGESASTGGKITLAAARDTAPDALLSSAYAHDMRSGAGRARWHGGNPASEYRTNETTRIIERVDVYPDGWTFVDPASRRRALTPDEAAERAAKRRTARQARIEQLQTSIDAYRAQLAVPATNDELIVSQAHARLRIASLQRILDRLTAPASTNEVVITVVPPG